MIENKSIGSKVFDVVNVVILILITLVCILPVWYVLCVSLSSRRLSVQGKLLSGRWDLISCHIRRSWREGNFFTSFLVSIKRVVLGTGVSMVCILLAAYPLSRTKNSFRRGASSCGSLYSACFSMEVLFRGISQ